MLLFETHMTSIALENTEPFQQKKSSLFVTENICKGLRGGKNGICGALRFCIGKYIMAATMIRF